MAFPFGAGQESGEEPGPRTPRSPKTGRLVLEPEFEVDLEGPVDPSGVDAETGVGVEFVVAGPWVSGVAVRLLVADVPGV